MPCCAQETQTLQRLIAKLDQHFLPKKNKDYPRFKLGSLVQQDDEPMATYYARIREIARKCSSTDENDRCHDTRPLNQNNAKQRDSCYCHCNGSVDKILYQIISQVHKFIHGRTGQYFLGGRSVICPTVKKIARLLFLTLLLIVV